MQPFGKLDLSIVDGFVHDLDNYFFAYPDAAFPASYSKYTGLCARAEAQKFVRAGTATPAQAKLADMSDKEVFHLAVKSYADHSDTTVIFSQEYGLNGVELYRRHHLHVMYNEVAGNFNGRVFPNPRLRQGLEGLADLGLSHNLFTNGTEEYAEYICDELNLSGVFDHVVGIDSFGNTRLTPKYLRAAFVDFLAHTKLPSRTGYVIGQTDRQMSDAGRDWSNYIFGDDSKSNLKAAKWLGFQTVLLKTDRVPIIGPDMDYIDHVICNVGEFYNALVPAIRQAKKDADPSYQAAPPRLITR